MRTVLVTGANRGIGLAVARRCLTDHDDTHVVLACRDPKRGEDAAASLRAERPGFADRVTVLEMDTSSDESVRSAAEKWRRSTAPNLYGVVNNAGIANGGPAEILNVNVRGPKRVDDAFSDLLRDGGRIVQMSSGAASGFVSRAPLEARERYFTNQKVTWAEIDRLVTELATDDAAAFEEGLRRTGLRSDEPGSRFGVPSAYGLSKALLNSYTVWSANERPHLKINSCSPGMVATDIFRGFLPSWMPVPGFLLKWAAVTFANAKTPDEGTFSTMRLLFDDDLEGNGWYYGSDGKRSPLDEYRSPGDPEYFE